MVTVDNSGIPIVDGSAELNLVGINGDVEDVVLTRFPTGDLGIILSFVGVKMLLAMNEYVNAFGEMVGLNINMPHIEVPTPISLAIIFGVLMLSMLLSVCVSKAKTK